MPPVASSVTSDDPSYFVDATGAGREAAVKFPDAAASLNEGRGDKKLYYSEGRQRDWHRADHVRKSDRRGMAPSADECVRRALLHGQRVERRPDGAARRRSTTHGTQFRRKPPLVAVSGRPFTGFEPLIVSIATVPGPSVSLAWM